MSDGKSLKSRHIQPDMYWSGKSHHYTVVSEGPWRILVQNAWKPVTLGVLWSTLTILPLLTGCIWGLKYYADADAAQVQDFSIFPVTSPGKGAFHELRTSLFACLEMLFCARCATAGLAMWTSKLASFGHLLKHTCRLRLL